MCGRRGPQPALLREARLAYRDECFPPTSQQYVIHCGMSALGERRFVLPCGTFDCRAKRSLMHDDRAMVVQPAAKRHQQSLPLERASQPLPQCLHQDATLLLTQPAKAEHLTRQLLIFDQRWSTTLHCAQRSRIWRRDRERFAEIAPDSSRLTVIAGVSRLPSWSEIRLAGQLPFSTCR